MPSFRWLEAGEELVLDSVGVLLEFGQVTLAGVGEGDDVAAPVCGVGLPGYPVVPSSRLRMPLTSLRSRPRRRPMSAWLSGRVFALVLGPVRTRGTAGDGHPDWITADQVGAVAVAASAAAVDGREIRLGSQAELVQALALLQGARSGGTESLTA